MVLPLFILEDEHSFKHGGGWLGKYFMLSKVLRSKKKDREKNRKMKKRRKEKKNERKKREE